MNLAEWSIRKSLITWVMTVLFLVVGWSSYQKLSRLEDPEFTIKDAVITTPYPGASAAEVEEEVTNVIEKAAQQMGQIKRVESRSSRGLSSVQVTMQDKYDKNSLPQVWDELRRKVNDAQRPYLLEQALRWSMMTSAMCMAFFWRSPARVTVIRKFTSMPRCCSVNC